MDFILSIDFPVWSKFYTPRDVVAYWKPTKYAEKIKIGDVEIFNNDYALADIDGVVIVPKKHIEEILVKSEELINTENLLRKAIREGMDPQKAYIKFKAF